MRASRNAALKHPHDTWPVLPLDEWKATFETLHMCTQIVGKTRLALAPAVNHWWHVALYVTARGLTTSAMPYDTRALEAEFDLLAHELVLRTSDGGVRMIPLRSRPVADFYHDYRATLGELGIDVPIWPRPVEIEAPIRFDEDRVHATYDPEAATRFWRALSQADRVLHEFRGRFIGKCSPVHFFWGSFDLACTRFSGRPAPEHPGGIPNLGDWVTREAYSHECISAGWWPGSGPIQEPAFYAYIYPEPPGFAAATVQPDGAYYHAEMRLFVLPQEIVRSAHSPDDALLDFFQSTYEAAAELAGWERTRLERGVAARSSGRRSTGAER